MGLARTRRCPRFASGQDYKQRVFLCCPGLRRRRGCGRVLGSGAQAEVVTGGGISQSEVVLADAAGVHGLRVTFHYFPEPKTVKERLHLEFITIRFEARTGRLTALGAWQVSDVEQGGASAKR